VSIAVMKVMKVMKVRAAVAAASLRHGSARVRAYITSITFITFITSSAAFAAEPFAAPRAAEPAATSPAAGLVQVTLSLLLVLAAVFAAAWAVRRLKGFGRLAPGAIEVIADVALGPKERAVLVQVGKQQLLLGVASGNVNTLHVLAEPVALTPRPPVLGQTTAEQTSSGTPIPPHLQFKTILKRSLGL
jgi:flagellar protein FliO/FliZ